MDKTPKTPTREVSEFDVCIVGAGVAGAILAHELVGHGHRVLILEAGRGTRADPDGWQTLVDNFYTTVAKVPNSPYPPNLSAPQPDVLDMEQVANGPSTKGYFVQQGPLPFGSDYARAKGGTTMHWLGTTLRMLNADFRVRSTYGVGVDWPISYEELKPYYERAEFEIGVAGSVADQRLPGVDPKTFWGDYQFPMQKLPEAYVARQFTSGLQDLKVPIGGDQTPVWTCPTPQGRNGVPNAEYVNPATGQRGFTPVGMGGDSPAGERCQGNSSCVPICPVQAKYSAHRTLNRAHNLRGKLGAGKLTIRNQSIASKVLIDVQTGRVQAINYLSYDEEGGPTTQKTAVAKTFIIAAHSVETAKLLLISGIANSSGQVGRNLMDHPALLTWGLTKDPVWPFRGPGSTTNIPTFRDGPFRTEHAPFIVPIDNWGWSWAAFAPGSQFAGYLNEKLFGTKLRERIAHDFSRQFALQWEFEQLPDAGNRVTIDERYTDAVGLPRPVITYNLSDYTRKAFEVAARISSQIFTQLEIEDHSAYDEHAPGYFNYQGKGYTFLGCGHLVGTHRMGNSPKDSVTDSWMRAWDHPNLFLVGCGAMPTLGTSNPTLTMAALAMRAADAIHRDLTKTP